VRTTPEQLNSTGKAWIIATCMFFPLIFFRLRCSVVDLKIFVPDPKSRFADPGPAKSFVSLRIRILNTVQMFKYRLVSRVVDTKVPVSSI
jgi:hypothetical protein